MRHVDGRVVMGEQPRQPVEPRAAGMGGPPSRWYPAPRVGSLLLCRSCGKVYEETDDPGNGLAFDCRACVGSLVRARDFALRRRGFDPLRVMAWQMVDAALPTRAAEVFR